MQGILTDKQKWLPLEQHWQKLIEPQQKKT